QARDARLFILDKMQQVIAEPRGQLSPYAPRITSIKINPEKIGALIGPGGKNIRGIPDATKTTIEVQDDATVNVASSSGTAADEPASGAGASRAAHGVIRAASERVVCSAQACRWRGDPMRRSRCSPTPASGGGGAVPAGHNACGAGKPWADCGRLNGATART